MTMIMIILRMFKCMKMYSFISYKLFIIIFLFECNLINTIIAYSYIKPQQQQQQQHQPGSLNANLSYQNNNYQSINSECVSDRLVYYKVILHTYWTRDLFPKHYPDWRPTAQWSKTVGRSHNTDYSLFHIGQQASEGVKEFAETGKTDILEQNSQSYYISSSSLEPKSSSLPLSTPNPTHSSFSPSSSLLLLSSSSSSSLPSSPSPSSSIIEIIKQNEGNISNILDEFSIPPILAGDGRSETKFFADNNHSLISLMTRIVPSPDWFIGIDSLQLCIGGTWIDTITLEMDPLDAGTDNGFTFTAPNWPTNPQGVIYRITSKYPSHPAGSFFYPNSKRLPPIATYQFIKLKEYELNEVFSFEEDTNKYETIKTQAHLQTEHNHVEINNKLSANIEQERQQEVTSLPIHLSEKDILRAKLLEKINLLQNDDRNATTTTTTNVNNIFNSESNYNRIRKQNIIKKKHKSRDCRVGHWSKWGPCNKTCGIGEMRRYRKILKYAKHGGKLCPPLQESKWCGTGKSCLSFIPPLTPQSSSTSQSPFDDTSFNNWS